MNIDQIINLLATITLIEMMITIGLGVAPLQIITVARDRGLLIRAALANYVCVPVAAILLFMLFRPSPMVAAGFLIAAVCPGAPYGPPFTSMAKGNVVTAIGLMVILAGSSAIVAPVLLSSLLSVVAYDSTVTVNVSKMIMTLLISQLLPLCAGLYVRDRHPAFAARIKKPFGKLSLVLNLTLLTVILSVQFRILAGIRFHAYLGMMSLLAARPP